jgi:3-oxoacyl-[acyl-carrier-protein] synthase-3
MLNILGMGYSFPSTIIDNKFLENLDVGTNAQWILDKIGIEERLSSLPIEYIAKTRNQDPRQAPAAATMHATDLGVAAGRMALERAGIKPSQVGMVLVNCCTPSKTTPAEAQRMAAALGINGIAYDVFTACPAFALHVEYLNNFRPEKLPDYILCISAATLTQKVNYNDRSDGAIWGDGGAAWVVSPRHAGKLRVIESYFASDPTRSQAVVVDTFGFFHQDGRAVRDFSVRQTVRLVKRLEEKYTLDWSKDVFIGHQANKTMLEQVTGNREIPADNHWHNVTKIGNQAGAGAPATLAMHWDKITPGMKIVVAVVGAGLSWGSILFEAN